MRAVGVIPAAIGSGTAGGRSSLLAGVILSCIASACAKPVTVDLYPDLDRRVTRMQGNEIKIDRGMSNSLAVNGAKVEELEGARYVLWLELRGSKAVRPQTMTLWVDDSIWEVDDLEVMDAQMACPEQTAAERSLGISEAFGCVYLELYWAPITDVELREIAAARQVTIRLDGIGGHVERQFSAENITNFAEFVGLHVAVDSDTSTAAPTGP